MRHLIIRVCYVLEMLIVQCTTNSEGSRKCLSIDSCRDALRNPGVDTVERPIAFTPQKGTPYDPRDLLNGCSDVLTGDWVSGFFDRDSFTETLTGWAETVVCGRARLGGIPMGVIITENRTREKKTPADPADLNSQETVVQQAGCVWFPDSASKTAQASIDRH